MWLKTASVVWWLACWPLVPKFASSNPAEVVGFFSVHEKILSVPSFGGEVKESIPALRHVKEPSTSVNYVCASQILV
jgi:hypothetical protein